MPTSVTMLEKNNNKLQNENTYLNHRIKELIEDLESEKRKRNQLEQYGRREMLELSGIPQNKDEDCIDIVFQN